MSATIISFMNRKGGVGKSTVITLTATALHNRSKQRIAVVDADPQLSVYKQRISDQETEGADENELYPITAFKWEKEHAADIPLLRFHKLIEEMEDRYDAILIDAPGKQEGQEIALILTVSDFVVVPLIASSFDLQSTLDFLQLIPPIVEEKNKQGYSLEVLGLVNKKDRSLENRSLQEIKGIAQLQMFEAQLSYLTRYKRNKSTISDIVGAKKEEDEFNQYYNEFCKLCKIN